MPNPFGYGTVFGDLLDGPANTDPSTKNKKKKGVGDSAMTSLLPNHPKSLALNKAADGEPVEYPSQYHRFRMELISSIHGQNRMRKHDLCVALKTLENVVRSINEERVFYRLLMAAHILKNTNGSPTDNEREQAMIGVFGNVPYVEEQLTMIAEILVRIRSMVGMKVFHETTAICWTSAKSAPSTCGDIVVGRRDDITTVAPNVLDPDSVYLLETVSQNMKVHFRIEDVEKCTPSTYVPDEIEWRNSEREFLYQTPSELMGTRGGEGMVQAGPSGSSSATSGLTMKDLVASVEAMYPESEPIVKHLMELIEGRKTSEELQGELIDLLGFEQFEMVGRVLEYRTQLCDEMKRARVDVVKLSQVNAARLNLHPSDPGYCQQVVVRSSAEAEMQKQLRKEQKRMMKEVNRIQHAFGEEEKLELELAQREMIRQRQLEMNQLKWGPSLVAPQSVREVYPFVFDAQKESQNALITINGLKYALPDGSERFSHRTHEEVRVPAVNKGSVQDVQHVYIKDMDDLGQKGFQGIEKLNVIQSIVFEQAYKTKENLLICAPTGAGKTNIAMLTILNTIHEHRRPNGEIVKDDFKIIYIAPMKALATEMTESFGKRLALLGLKVRELTGDTQLSKKEISETQMLILTPEKWDVVTRKAGDDALTGLVRLLIIDEVHLLHDDRGPVIETIVARTLRQVEMSQSGIRIVGLSATLPNYVDVARFLRVNPYKGMFFFDGRFRPVPLSQKFIGVKKNGGPREMSDTMDEICYNEVLDFVRRGHQVLVFVHARNATARCAQRFRELAANTPGDLEKFLPPNINSRGYVTAKKTVQSSRNRQLLENFQFGMGIHHAGLQRGDRLLMEKMFAQGHIQVLFCTSTLAWGVNLPAHAVVIRGTDVFDSEKGAFSDLGVLDVQQIFGRAGRPQFENEGHGIIITWQRTLDKYLGMLIRQAPIESQFLKKINDNLNAEIALGTVSTIDEAVEWLSYSYYHIRAMANPIAYGLPHNITEQDPQLRNRTAEKLKDIAAQLDRQQMIRYDTMNQFLSACDLGRIASNFYIKFETIEMLNATGQPVTFDKFMPDDMVLGLVAQATEFTQLKIREEEMIDLEELVALGCYLPIRGGGLASVPGKVNCLLQTYISRVFVTSFSLSSESLYVQQNASRLCRAFFEISLRKGWAQTTNAFLTMSKCVEKRMWPNQSGLRQLTEFLRLDWIEKIERRKLTERQLLDFTAKELGHMLSCDGEKVYEALRMIPRLECEATLKPITHSIIKVEAEITPAFFWNDRLLGKGGAQSFWILLENIDENLIIHQERLSVNKKKVVTREKQVLVFTIPIRDRELTNNFQLRIASDFFVTEDTALALSMHNCVLPKSCTGHTDLLPLDPLPISTLRNTKFESIYNFGFFNPIQTQVFHCLYKTDENALIGAPTGSGKTMCAELAIFRLLNDHPGKKCVYIAPMKALVRERVADWKEKFEKKMGHKVLELSGDHTPDTKALNAAPILITTPEKWDGVTRSWSTRDYVREVGLIVIDEIHLLGVDRGNVLEAIVTRLKILTRRSCVRSESARLLGLSTALANAGDVGEWLGVKELGLFNFRPSVRPVPINVHIAGFPGQHYCPRMALMNKPAFKAILTYSPLKPVIVFVASRRQTRLTAMAFISHLVTQDDPRQWLHMQMDELEDILRSVKDENLKLTLPFGIGMHHAGLQPHERAIVEQLFLDKKIQVLIATATLAWGINMPAHLVIVKGTEYFDGKTCKYIDFPVTDVLQMMGRAGRPQFDSSAVAVVYVQDVKKNFYKKFLYEPFPVESSLLPALANHVNAEVHSGTITTRQGIMEYLAGTYLYRRLFANPNYYGIEELTEASLCQFLSSVVDGVVNDLVESKCIVVDDEEGTLHSSPFGRLASIYYLDHKTVRFFHDAINRNSTMEQLLKVLCDAPEYAEIPVRHNEDVTNGQIARGLRIKLAPNTMESPHTKAHILFQAHFSRLHLPTDYRTDQRSVLDQSIRILQAMRDICILRQWLSCSLSVSILMQMCHMGRWWDDHPLLCLPYLTENDALAIDPDVCTIPELQHGWNVAKAGGIDEVCRRQRKTLIEFTTVEGGKVDEVISAVCRWPLLSVSRIHLSWNGGQCPIAVDGGQPVWNRIPKGSNCKLRIDLETLGPNRFNSEAFLSQWPKEKNSGWVCVVGEKDGDQLAKCQFVPSVTGRRTARVDVVMPEKSGRVHISVFILSDCYMGIDQEYIIYADLY